MKKYKVYIVALVTSVFGSEAFAENTYTNGFENHIEEILAFSSEDNLVPQWAGMTQLTFTSNINWVGGEGCSIGGVAIRNQDKHLISIAIQAYAMKKPLKLYADSTQKVGSNCILRALATR
ncbi:MAG: hypothetical protein ACFHVJ_11005 [Aestuariibacter sp.]